MSAQIDHIAGHTWHGRKGAVRNGFRYSIDYVMLDAEADVQAPRLFSRNRRNLTSLLDRDHGGAPGHGRGAEWARQVLRQHQIPQVERLMLLAQPRVLGHVFNPVSFWLGYNGEDLTVVIAEVTNTFGERHSYLCHHPDLAAIGPQDRLSATKIFYVSPFQPIEGDYGFRFDIGTNQIAIRIEYGQGDGGLIATLSGPRQRLTNAGILAAMLRRPLGSRRVLALIHWQALKLWWKGARYRVRDAPPTQDVTRG